MNNYNYIENINIRDPDYLKKFLPDEHTSYKKIKNTSYVIPTIYNIDTDAESIIITNYKTQDLKTFLRSNNYELSTTGTKLELWTRLITYLKISSVVLKIQTVFRKWKVSRILKLFNKYELSKKICVNDTDFYNLDALTDIPKYQFISFEDTDKKLYGFNISSLYTLLTTKSSNPYNRNAIPSYIINEINNIVKYKDILCLPTIFNINTEYDPININQIVELRAVRLFQYINNDLGNYADSNWFMTLTPFRIIRMIKYLKDIWSYRAELTNGQRYNICPRGDPFNNFTLRYDQPSINIKNEVLALLEKFVYSGINIESKILGAYYVLGSLTLVNRDAAECMPWLYESFRDDL